ncbi:MAG: PTS sugar transporter subunit IIA [Desulfobacterota bacterium]|nr:PTS sugar transporter subunit IIA [Thermodesulfobacteriota bacterium]
MAAENRADTFLRMIRRSRRGRLKVYLGYAAGVGKTYEMLQEAHRLQTEGIDVIVGLVETHGRTDTARLLNGLEIVPRRRIEYRGIVLEEMDTEAILKRAPEIVLIDELAHTNVPGSRNAKRYQDVQDILAKEINVITTMNIQHLESLYDIVEKASGVRVFERIPDSVLADADQIVNVDVTTEDLSERLREGKVYPLERIETALSNFFRKANLEQLRELTLRELASQIDLRARDDLKEDLSATPDQIMVCLSSRGPNSERLLRYASRLAGRLNRNWYAVYVQTPSEEPTVIDAVTQRLLADTLTLAKQLGAIVFTFKGEDVVKTILQFAKEYRVGHIIIGSPERIPWWQWIRGRRSIAESLIREARDVTVVVQDTRAVEVSPAEAVVREEPEVEPAPAINVEAKTLSRVMSVQAVRMWDMPLKKNDLLRELTGAALRSAGIPQNPGFLAAVLAREDQGSTFFNEGVAFPHARITGIGRACVALGLTRAGVSDVVTDKPIECVFLILTPEEDPDTQIRILGLASRAVQDRQLVERLRSAARPEDAFKALQVWELIQEGG